MEKRDRIRVDLSESLSRLIRERCAAAGRNEAEYVEEAVLEKIEFEDLDDRQLGGFAQDSLFPEDDEVPGDTERKRH
jgi:hypothetical protein